jgi:hypothetical protein
MYMVRRALLLSCVFAALIAAPASAQRCTAPPGTAAIEQYCETLPSATGVQRSDRGGAVAPRPVPAQTLKELDESGAAGQELAAVLTGTRAAATPRTAGKAAPEPRARSEPRPAQARATPPPEARASTGNPLGAVQAAVTGGETVGNGFFWVLLAIAAGIGGAGWLRHARRPGG